MVSTSSHMVLQSPSPIVNRFSLGENSSVRFRQSSTVTAAAGTCASEFTASRCSTPTLPNFPANSPASFYETLGIHRGATIQDIKAAYRKLARVFHPDVAAIDQKADKFMKINAAYCTLSDSRKRAAYDRSLFRRRQSNSYYSGGCAPSAMSGSTAYTTRNWETDQCW